MSERTVRARAATQPMKHGTRVGSAQTQPRSHSEHGIPSTHARLLPILTHRLVGWWRRGGSGVDGHTGSPESPQTGANRNRQEVGHTVWSQRSEPAKRGTDNRTGEEQLLWPQVTHPEGLVSSCCLPGRGLGNCW